MTDQRTVHINLTMHTHMSPDDVRLRILAAIGDQFTIDHVSAVDLDTVEVKGEVQLVICPVRGLLGAFVDAEDNAQELAREQGAVLVKTYADDDYRGEVTA